MSEVKSKDNLKLERLIKSIVRKKMNEQYVAYTKEYYNKISKELCDYAKKKNWDLKSIRSITIDYIMHEDRWYIYS